MQPAAVSCLHAGLLQVCSAQQTPITQTAVAGVSINICSLEQEEAPFWYINDTLYDLFGIPLHFPYIDIVVVGSYNQLAIPVVVEELSNTLFQCGHVDHNNGHVVLGAPQRLLVEPSECTSIKCEPKNYVVILLRPVKVTERVYKLVAVATSTKH